MVEDQAMMPWNQVKLMILGQEVILFSLFIISAFSDQFARLLEKQLY